ncbi:hypothetical protein [Phycicoccus flavus]|uniref:DUF1396 domain-containing protein n=1 Tax=Phycicoccus flavus TaxID=2502783 RepID=A0A8T6R0U5_9MICO|nr:hypothetical protein [Phycicoccus flavus]NHA67352.1 hypothetical protein [Phycicoccus flavus]
MKRAVLSTVALCGALALGACGSTGSTATTGGDTAASSSPSAAASAQDAAAVAEGDTVPVSELGKRSTAAVEAEGTAHLTMTAGDAQDMEARLDYSGKAPKMSMTMTNQGETVDMVYLGNVMYLGSESFAEMTGGKRWIKIDPDGTDMMSRMMGPLLDEMASSMGNPATQLETYGDSDATVVSVEDGVTTYEITVTKAQMKKALKNSEATMPGVTEETLEHIPAEGLTYTMSFDEQDLPVTMSMEVQSQSFEMTYSKWGEPVDIAAPPAKDVGTLELPTDAG